jgi:hypothetical protein
VLQTRACTPTLYPSIVFTFGLTIESIKKFGGALEKECEIEGEREERAREGERKEHMKEKWKYRKK